MSLCTKDNVSERNAIVLVKTINEIEKEEKFVYIFARHRPIMSYIISRISLYLLCHSTE